MPTTETIKKRNLNPSIQGMEKLENTTSLEEVIVLDKRGRVLIYCLPSDSLSTEELEQLKNALDKLQKKWPQRVTVESNRGSYVVRHICCWKKYSNSPRRLL
eukprot:TRINITY_DN9073_c0_g1_i1.p2 TRINITY_DN9073_c0_g1~~TRINITY_DN9073_c0_g1_i1.p2  ORF type:complete len:102 (+),score=13.41 TRINITY_DN9073_c0_g1_i1:69-374(+)